MNACNLTPIADTITALGGFALIGFITWVFFR